MKSKRLISLLLTLVLLGSMAPALAAKAGSQQDPLLSRSYVETWSSTVLEHAGASARSAVQSALEQALQTYDSVLHSTTAGSRICTMLAGNTVSLKTGDCFTVLSGSASVDVSAGVLVDTTDGRKAASGALRTAHRYIACENVQATITSADTVSLLLSSGASVVRFVDVPGDAWYAGFVEYAAVNGLMGGVGNRCFAPNTPLTRAMFVMVLSQVAHADTSKYTPGSFTDVVPGSWYASCVEWAAQEGIVGGVGNGRFLPNAPITREQMAAIIARYAENSGKTLPRIENPPTFRDMDQVAGWARSGVELLRTAGLMAGTNGYFDPTGITTRAQAATVFMRLREAFLAAGA